MTTKHYNYWQEKSTGYIIETGYPQGRGWVQLSKSEGRALFQEQNKIELLKTLSPGDTVLTVLRHVSASGMQRRIDLFTIKDNRMVYLSGYAEHVGVAKRHPTKQGLIVNGCGMDMGFDIVYRLAGLLFNDGYALKHELV